jgi:peptidoglycan/LPS O-acetylase OafA/YrhL
MNMSASSSPFRLRFFDGLRGWAAVCVLLFHTESSLLNLGFLNVGKPHFFFDGTLAVYVFFVLSGVVLSFGLMESGNARRVAKAMVKRGPRLVVPILVASFLGYVLMKAGMMHNAAAAQKELAVAAIPEGSVYFPWLQSYYGFAPDFWGMLRFAFFDVFFSADSIAKPASYDGVLWTMPAELLGSFVVFGSWLMLAESQKKRWLAGVLAAAALGAAFYFENLPARCIGLFLFGAWIAHQYAHQGRILALCQKTWAQILLFVAIVALYGEIDRPIIAMLIVLWTAASPLLQRLFSARISVFLGDISFPLYLVHMPIICSAMSWLIVEHYAQENVGISLAIWLATVAFALLAAWLLCPVERLAIFVSRKIGEWFFG